MGLSCWSSDVHSENTKGLFDTFKRQLISLHQDLQARKASWKNMIRDLLKSDLESH